MTEEKRQKVRDNFNTALLCGLVCIVVGHLHSFFGGEDNTKESKYVNAERVTKNDSIRINSVSTADFVKNQIQQQKTR